MLRYLSFVFFLSGSIAISAQDQNPAIEVESSKIRFIPLSIGSMKVNVKDDAMSPFAYDGGIFSVSSGFHKTRPGISRSRFDIGFASGRLAMSSAETFTAPNSEVYRVTVDYEYLRHLKNWRGEKLGVWLGGALLHGTNVRLNYQLDNSLATYEALTSLAVVGLLERSWEVGNNQLVVAASASLPVTTHVMRPDFLNRFNFPNPESNFISDNFERGGFYFWNRAFRFKTDLEVAWVVWNQNRLFASYCWDFYHFNPTEGEARVTGASHDFQLGIQFAF